MAGRSAKTSAVQWVEAAKAALIEEGIAGVRVDRLATALTVTRGGFYHNFRNRDGLLSALLDLWDKQCRLTPDQAPAPCPSGATDWLDDFVKRLIDEHGYDHQFDMAVRDWARSDPRAAWAMERADRQRIDAMRQFFAQLGYAASEAELRARVLYYHQIGYYALGVRESRAARRRNVPLYLRILIGEDWEERARIASATASVEPAVL